MPSSSSRHVFVTGDMRGHTFYGPYVGEAAGNMNMRSLSGQMYEMLPPPNAREDPLTIFACLLDTLGLRAFDDERLSHLQDLGLTPTEVAEAMALAQTIHLASRRS